MKNLAFIPKILFLTIGSFIIKLSLFAQLSGVKTIPGDYSTIASAVTALNTSGVGTGGVTFNIAANYNETIAATISLTATGTAANPIVFEKDPATVGADPLITAYTGGIATPASATQDGIWRLVGSDYVTINGIDLRDNPANTSNPSTMEYGYALYKASTSNGCQYVTIENCTITLNNINNAAGTAPMTDGSAGIIIMNALPTAANAAVGPISGGTNSYNKIYSNTIQNANIGISVIGYAAASPFTLADMNNDIGGSSSATGNTIINYGGGTGATIEASGIRTAAQYGLNVSYNTIKNNNGSGTNHPAALWGIYSGAATSANITISNNTITLNGGGTTQAVAGIENAGGSTAAGNTVNITNNTITNSTYTTATTGGFLGIYNNGGTPATLNISSNTVSNNASAAATTGFFYSIYNNGAATNAVITNNIISGNSTGLLTTGLFTGVYNNATNVTLSISNNTFFGNSTTSVSGIHYPIYNKGAVTTTININSNNIGTSLSPAITFNAANSGSQCAIVNTGGAATAALSISNNNIQGYNYSVTGSGANTYISNSAVTLSQTINSNAFTNMGVGTTGSITFISNSVALSATGTQSVNGNYISGTFTKTAVGGTVTLFTNSASSVAGSVISNSNNNFSNITVSGATTIAGWINTDAGASIKNIQNNVFSNWTGGTSGITAISVNITGTNNSTSGNTISNITSAGAITGITTGAGNNNIYANTIDTFTTTGAAAITGIAITAGTSNKIYKNKIYDLQASIAGGTVYGIAVSGSTITSATIYNNTIGNLRTPAASAADPIRGISVTATAANSTINVYYNTIYLNASSTGTNFGTTGIYHTASATATTATLNLKNNIVINNSIPNGTGLIVAFRRSSTTLTNYASTSNNNLFFCGAPGTTRLIFYDGTNSDQILTSYKTRVSTRDANTVTEDLTTKFLSTTGSSSSFLHLDPAKSTLAESGGTSITNYTDDNDGDTRYGGTGYAGTGTAPDIGADEISGLKGGGLSGTYNVGTGQTFTSLTKTGGLFAAINCYGLSGNVTVNITSDLTEDGANTLFKWVESGAGNYTLTIQPDASSLRTISGDVISGLIRFNNASRVTIDGSNGTSNQYLTFRNLNTAGTTGTAFTFINGSANDTIRYCNVEAYANATNAAILFGTSTIAGGNSYNTISDCNINATVNSNTGNVCIYSAGTVGNENSSNTISNNNIYNYRDRALDITATGSTAWTISGNSFYNGDVTGSINYAAATTLHGIRVLGGSGYSILNNYIGGNAAFASGTTASYSSSAGILSFQGILLTATSASPASNIKGNTIASLSVAAVPTSTTAANVFIGIETNGSGINIGGNLTGEGNIIGSNTSNSSVAVTTTTAAATYKSIIRGINCQSTGGVVTGNQVSSIDIKNIGAAPGPSTFIGIYVNNATPPSLISSNIIGSNGAGAASNSIRVLSTSTCTTTALYGISIGASVTSTIQVSSNTIANISHQSATASGSLTAINNSATSTAVVTITSDTISTNTCNATTGSLYGIYSNAAPSSLTISNNTITGNISTATTTGLLYGIYTAGTPGSITITGNIFSANSTSTLTTGLFTGIYNIATPSVININSNSFYSNTTTSVSGAFYPIYQAGAVTGTININSNNIGTASASAITYNAANSGAQYFIYNTAGTAAAALSMSNNTVQGINYATAGTGANTYIINTAATLSQAINGNTFTNLNVNTSGSITFISNSVIVSATGTQNVNNNSISGTFTKKAGGTLTLFTSAASSVSGSVINNNNNNFSNITVTGATTIAGWINTDAGSSTKTIQNNTFSNWSCGTSAVTVLNVNLTGTSNATTGNTINNISSAGAITGITTGAGNDNIYSNTINTLSTTAASAVTAIAITAGTTKNIYKNKIYDISGSNATSTVNGILVSGGTTVNVYNNIIGDLRTSAANSATDAIRGISVTSATVTSAINVYYNTVYINATSTGTNFGSTGIYHTVSATATTAALTLRNNSVTNTSTPKGTGLTVVYRRSSNTLTNYGSASNNNLFYAGTPSASKLIFYDGTNSDQTLATYKTRVSTRDVASVSEDLTTKFLSTTGSSSVFLHMNSSVSTLIESGGANVSGFTDDFDGQIRAGNTGYTGASTSPDIGADEIFGLETTPPTISYTSLSNTTSTANLNVTGISITDASGVNNVSGTRPRIYYKRYSDTNTWLDNTSSSNGWKYAEATNTSSPYSFTIDYSLLYGGSSVTAGAIQYFIVAQDLATTANIAINSGTFTSNPASVALTSSAFPITGTINSYNIPFSGTYNVGSSEVFNSLTKSNGLFAAINTVGLMGNTTINITSDLTEDGTAALNQWTESGAGNYTLTIQPDAATQRTIAGDAVSGLIRLNGADRVTIDGSNGGSGSYLSFKNTNASGTTGTAFTFLNGATNNTIKYCDAEAYSNASNGVVFFSTSASAGNSNNIIDNCTINATVSSNTGNVAIYSAGTTGNENSNNTISNNLIYNYRDRGIDIAATGSSAWSISNNSFYNGNVTGSINYAANSALHGIRISGGSGYSILNNYIGGNTALASGSKAAYSSTLGNLSYQGILLNTSSASPASYIKGNTIALISLTSVPTAAGSIAFSGIETSGSGINIGGTLAGDGNLIGSNTSNSSIVISTSTTSIVNTSLIRGISSSSNGGIIYGNNIGGINITNTGTSPAASSFQGIYINSVTAPSQVNYNIIGSETKLNNIKTLAASTATTTSLTGISIGNAVTTSMDISYNVIENLSQLSTTSSGSFTGINNGASTAAVISMSNDTIQNINAVSNANAGSSVYAGIISASPSTIDNNLISNITLASNGSNAQLIGIDVSGNAAHTISNNFISTLSTASVKTIGTVETASPAGSAAIAILNEATAAGQSIFNNTISGINATSITVINDLVTGIGITSSGSGNIYNNRISGLSNTATGSAPGICGITAFNGSFNVYNNAVQVSNSYNIDGASNVNGVRIYGIDHATANNWNYYFNTIIVGGNATGNAARSAAFLRSLNGSVILKDNVFANKRTGTGSNYAISNITSPASTGWAASDYNDLYSSNTTTTAEWGNGIDKTFALWQTASGSDAHSFNHAVSIVSSTYDLQPDSSTNCSLSNTGIAITSPVNINTDISGGARNISNPDIGAYEFTYNVFAVTASNSSPVCSASTVSLTSDPGDAVSPAYLWLDPNRSVVGTTQNPSISAMAAGNYTVLITDFYGCTDSSVTNVSLTTRPTGVISGSASVCNGSSTNITITVTGSGSINGTLSNGDLFSGTAPNITVVESPTSTTNFTIAALSDAGCSSISSDLTGNALVTINTGIWTGAVSTDWSNPSNWCGGLPTDTTDISIASGLTNYPVMAITDSVRNINISSGASLTISSSNVLAISGTITNSGTLTNNGTILLNGTTAQSFPGNGTIAAMNNLNVNNAAGITINRSFSISGTLTPINGVINLADKNITLASDASKTANVGTVTGNFAYSAGGRFIVQRYFPARRAWRLLTAPVTSSGTIYNTWQNSGVYTAGQGIFITGANPSAGNGLDASPQGGSSMKQFNISTQSLTTVTNTKVNVSVGNNGSADNTGYFVFVRGDRNPGNLSQYSTNSTTISCTGKLQTGTQTFIAAANSGAYTLIGNPYASSVNFNNVSRTNIIKRFYTWDPNLNISGGYVMLDDIDNDGVFSSSVMGSAQGKDIQSGQAFFVQTLANGTASITFNESSKSSVNNNLVFRPESSTQEMDVALYLLNADSTTILADGTAAQYNDIFSDSVTLEDARKLGNVNENLALMRHGIRLALERRPVIKQNDTLYLNLTNTTKRNYRFIITPTLLNQPGTSAVLLDKYLSKEISLSLTDKTIIDFNLDSVAASQAADRFSIIFRSLGIVPVTFTNMKASQQQQHIAVSWSVANQVNVKQYIVERSTDGKKFSEAGIVPANAITDYTWTDSASSATVYYRIVSVANSGSLQYSKTVMVKTGKEQSSMLAIAEVNGIIRLQFNNAAAGIYYIKLLNSSGQLIQSQKISCGEESEIKYIDYKKGLAGGTYYLEIITPDGERKSLKLIH